MTDISSINPLNDGFSEHYTPTTEAPKEGDRVRVIVEGTIKRRWLDDSLVVVHEKGTEFGLWDLELTNND